MSVSAFGVLMPVVDFFWNAWITQNLGADLQRIDDPEGISPVAQDQLQHP